MSIKSVKSVAIIGAGPAGLAAAKYLLAEKCAFTKIDIFEQRKSTGGVWNHTPASSAYDPSFHVPRQLPQNKPELDPFPSPVYDFLETNIPKTLMRFSDHEYPPEAPLFPHHSVVLEYLQQYGKDIQPYISFETQVLDVAKPNGPSSPWLVHLKDLVTEKVTQHEYDAVIVASGHYSEPFVPDIPGLAEFAQQYPDAIVHSKFFRDVDPYSNKKVIVVGSLASGIDISYQLTTVAKLPVLVSEKTKYASSSHDLSSPTRSVGEIVEFLPTQKAVRFADGTVETDIDSALFCTGYHYSYPFLQNIAPPVLVPDGSYLDNLWEHMLYIDDPTLAFLCVPQRIVPFPVSEGQSAFIARMWSGRLDTPSKSEMKEWSDDLARERGNGKARHILSYPADLQYINYMHNQSVNARVAPERNLDNDGKGKIPPYWGEEQGWIRERMALIKMATRQFGDRRHEIKSLAEMGFDYKQWKASQ